MITIAGNHYSPNLIDLLPYATGRRVKCVMGLWGVYGGS